MPSPSRGRNLGGTYSARSAEIRGRTSQIDRIELHRPDIEKLAFPVCGDLGNNLRFADAAGAPDVRGHTLIDQRMQRLVEF